MKAGLLNSCPVVNDLIENENCYISYEESGKLGSQPTVNVKLISDSGNVVAQSRSIVSMEKAISALEKRAREKMNEKYDKKYPFKILKKKISRINLLHETKRGSYPQVGGYSQPMIDWAIDENGRVVEVPVLINLGGAGNTIIHFDALKDSSWVSVSAQSISGFFLTDSVGKILEAIANYLYIDLSVRQKEMEQLMKESKTYERQFKRALKSAKEASD